MIFNCRCTLCDRRRSLAKEPHMYVRLPKCECGSRSWRVDRYRMKVEKSRKKICYCAGYYFAHRKQSGSCHYNQNFQQ